MSDANDSAPVVITLTPFDGLVVAKTTIKVTKAGDGLSQALAIEPQELHHGQKVYVVLETEVDKVQFRRLDDAPNMLDRQHVLVTQGATIVPRETVIEMLTAQRVKLELAAEKAKGVERLLDEKGQAKTGLASVVGDGTAVSRALGEPQPGEDAEGFYDAAADPAASDPAAGDDEVSKKRKARGSN